MNDLEGDSGAGRPNDELTRLMRRERETFALNLRETRRRKGISQVELGKRACVTQTYISEVERSATNPTLDIIARLAAALQAPVADLLQPPRDEAAPATPAASEAPVRRRRGSSQACR